MAVIISVIHGCMNTVNKMLNVKAGRVFGAVNGALVNYVEATLLSLILIFLVSGGSELLPAHIAEVPFWVYLGGVCGVAALVVIIFITPKTHVVLSSILTLVGNLLGAVVMDWLLFEGKLNLMKIIGIFLILCGAGWIEWQKEKKSKSAENA